MYPYLIVRPEMDAFGSHWSMKYEFYLGWSTASDPTGEGSSYITTGQDTTACRAIWYMFIVGKRVEGHPSAWKVAMGPREAKLFRWVVESTYIRKQKYWVKMLEDRRDKAVVFRELEKELPKWLLVKKLGGGV